MMSESNNRYFQLPEWANRFIGKARYKIAYGGRGAGRSWTFARLLLFAAQSEPLRIMCAREYQVSIHDSVHALLRDQIQMMNLGGFSVVHNSIRHNQTGSEFIFRGLARNADQIKSIEGIDIAWVEEAHSVSDESWDYLLPTIRKEGSEIWMSFNPNYEDDPTYQRFIVNPPPDSIIVKCDYRDNPFFSETQNKDRLHTLRSDPDRHAHVYLGECRSSGEARIFKDKYEVTRFNPEHSWQGPYYGADWGFARDPTVLIKCWIHDDKLWIEYESCHVGLDIDKTPKVWEVDIPGANRAEMIYADSARPETISYMRRQGWRITSAAKWAGSVLDGISYLRGFDKIIIHERCINAAEEARAYCYQTAGRNSRSARQGDLLPFPADAHNHCWDSIRYALSPLIKNVGKKAAGLW